MDAADTSILLGGVVNAGLIGVGTNRWGARRVAHPELKPAFEKAVSLGLTFFDTAEVYGFGGSERTLGYCIRASGRPPVIATKFYPMPWRLRGRALIGALRASLARLGLNRVDLYMVHFPFPPVPVETWADALADAVHAGLARAVGVSNFNAVQMRRTHSILASRGVPLACNEVEYSLLNRHAERSGLLSLCREMGVVLIAYRPLALGLLSGRHSRKNPPSGWRRFEFSRLYPAHIEPVSELLKNIGDAHGGKTPTQVALNWVICKGALPIAGATRPEHVSENAGALGWRLTDGEIAALEAAEEKLRGRL